MGGVLVTGMVEAEEEEVLLESELMPEVSGDNWEVDSQNFSWTLRTLGQSSR